MNLDILHSVVDTQEIITHKPHLTTKYDIEKTKDWVLFMWQ